MDVDTHGGILFHKEGTEVNIDIYKHDIYGLFSSRPAPKKSAVELAEESVVNTVENLKSPRFGKN